MVERRIPRVQEIILPVLREALPGVLVTSWIPDVDRRSYPLVNIRKVGGIPVDMDVLDRQTIELQAIGNESLAATEDLYYDARYVMGNGQEPDGYPGWAPPLVYRLFGGYAA